MNTRNFSTRTEYRQKNNPKCDNVHIIGLDMGYSGPKCFHENGNFVFPNYCQKLTGELFGKLSKTDIIYEDIKSSDKYCVGEIASRSLSENDVVAEDALFGRNHYLHPNFLITFRTSLALALWDIDTDGSDVFIQTGLPPAYIKQDEPYLRSVIRQNHNFKVTMGDETKTFDITIKDDQIDVMYQPMGSFYSIAIDANGNITGNLADYMNSNLMVFDGGFGTLDKFFVKGKQLETKDTNPNLGMKRVLEETRKLIQQELNTSVSIPAMQTCLKTGVIKVNDLVNLTVKEYPISPYLEKANEKVREEAFESIKDYVFDIKYLIMTGGTGSAWCEYFKEKLKNIPLNVIPGNQNSSLPTVYANARGYYMYRLNQFKMRK